MRKPITVAIVAVIGAACALSAEPNAVSLTDPVEFPQAGFQMSFLTDTTFRLPKEGTGLAIAGGEDSVTLLQAIPGDPNLPVVVKDVVERMTPVMLVGYGQPQRISSEAIEVAGQKGWQTLRLATSKTGSRDTFVSVIWPIGTAATKASLYGYLELKIVGEDPTRAGRLAEAMLRSVKSIPAKFAATAPLPNTMIPVELPSEGFAIAVPCGWYLQRPMGRTPHSGCAFQAAVMDFAQKHPAANINVNVQDVENPADFDFAKASEKVVQWASKDPEAEVLSHSASKVDGRQALELVTLRQVQGVKLLMVQRQLYANDRVYTLTLCVRKTDPKPVQKMMDALAETFKILPLATSRPAPEEPTPAK